MAACSKQNKAKKTAKIIKRSYYPSSHRLNVNVLMSNIVTMAVILVVIVRCDIAVSEESGDLCKFSMRVSLSDKTNRTLLILCFRRRHFCIYKVRRLNQC